MIEKNDTVRLADASWNIAIYKNQFTEKLDRELVENPYYTVIAVDCILPSSKKSEKPNNCIIQNQTNNIIIFTQQRFLDFINRPILCPHCHKEV